MLLCHGDGSKPVSAVGMISHQAERVSDKTKTLDAERLTRLEQEVPRDCLIVSCGPIKPILGLAADAQITQDLQLRCSTGTKEGDIAIELGR